MRWIVFLDVYTLSQALGNTGPFLCSSVELLYNTRMFLKNFKFKFSGNTGTPEMSEYSFIHAAYTTRMLQPI